jgi:hypothetical protein
MEIEASRRAATSAGGKGQWERRNGSRCPPEPATLRSECERQGLAGASPARPVVLSVRELLAGEDGR